MKRSLKDNKRFIGLLLKGALLAYFACFFLGKNVMTNILSFNDNDYELYEEMETEDSEEGKETDDTKIQDKFRGSISNLILHNPIKNLRTKAWNRALVYEGFQRELPDPPPES